MNHFAPTRRSSARIEAIAAAKRELPEALPGDGTAVLNIDDPLVKAMSAHTRAHVSWFGLGAGADVRGSDVESLGAEGFRFTLEFQGERSEEHTSELQSLMRISYAVFCLKKK